MRLIPVLGDDEDARDPKQQWVSFARAYWAENVGSLAQVSGIAGGLEPPEVNEYNLDQVLPVHRGYFGGFRPWAHCLVPPAFTPLSLPVFRPVTPVVYAPGKVGALNWYQPPPDGQVPVANLLPPRSVIQIDALAAPSGIGRTMEQFESHINQSSNLTMAAYGVYRNELRAKPSWTKVAGALRRGGELAWDAGKVVVKVGGRVLTPVGHAMDLYDLYRFVKWAESLPTPPPQVPKCGYEPASNQIECTFKDGTVITRPAWDLPDYIKYRY